MALSVRGTSILSLGEFRELIVGLDPDSTGTGALQAWYAGEQLGPEVIHAALNIDARLASRSPQARAVIDTGLRRLEAAFPGVGT